jgi:hypothetical protein
VEQEHYSFAVIGLATHRYFAGSAALEQGDWDERQLCHHHSMHCRMEDQLEGHQMTDEDRLLGCRANLELNFPQMMCVQRLARQESGLHHPRNPIEDLVVVRR